MSRASVLAFAMLLAACGLGDTIVIGAAEAPAGAGGAGATAGGGQGGSASAPLDAGGMNAPADAAHDAQDHDATLPDGSAPSGCIPADPSAPILRCTRGATSASLVLTTLFTWPAPDAAPIDLNYDAIPLVANFTDDNGDGRTDVCDTPDVLVRAADAQGFGALYLLSGADGSLHRRFATSVAASVSPAIADLDRDGTLEVITLTPEGQLLVLDEHGATELRGESSSLWDRMGGSCIAMGVAELDGDDQPEILAGFDVFNSDGTLRFSYGGNPEHLNQTEAPCHVALTTDVDRDGAPDVVFPYGVVQDSAGDLIGINTAPGSVRIADVIAGSPAEVVFASADSITLWHGELSASIVPTLCGSTIAGAGDLDGDGVIDMTFANCGITANKLESDMQLTTMWQSSESPSSGAVSAFDFLGDGTAEVLHVSADGIYVHDGPSGVLREQRSDIRTSGSLGGPVIADVDNDGSADVLLIAETDVGGQLFALSAPARSFVPVRRIYNQYANVVTHIDENGLVVSRPQEFPLSHQTAQIEGEHLCIP